MRLNQYHCIFHKDYKKEIAIPVLSKHQLPRSQQAAAPVEELIFSQDITLSVSPPCTLRVHDPVYAGNLTVAERPTKIQLSNRCWHGGD